MLNLRCKSPGWEGGDVCMLNLREDLIACKPALQHSIADDVDAAAEIEFFHGVGFVCLDSFDTELETRGDFLVAIAQGDCFEHFLVAFRDTRNGGIPDGACGKNSNYFSRKRRIEITVSGSDLPQRAQQLGGRTLLEHITRRA